MKLRAGLALAAIASPALAHTVEAPGSRPEPWIALPLLLGALMSGIGWARLHARSGRGASGLRRRGVLLASGWLALAGAVLSPLHAIGQRSFTAHMIEHELLMLAAAPLLVLSRPLPFLLWAFPAPARSALGQFGQGLTPTFRMLAAPLTATALQAAALWLWHAPRLFDLALRHEAWHLFQHATFLVSALLFWSAMLHSHGARRNPLQTPMCLFVTSLVGGGLGALMALSPSPWYGGYAALGLTPFGLSPAEDQQLAGLLMWIPGGAVHAAAALAFLGAALKGSDRVAANR